MPSKILTNEPEQEDFEQLYKKLVRDLGTFAIFAIDVDGTITSWNQGVRANLGYSERDFIGLPFSSIFCPEDNAANASVTEMETARREGTSSDRRWHMRRDGSRVFVDGVLTALSDAGEQLLGFAKIMRDATAEHLAESRLGNALEFAQAIVNTVREPTIVLDGELRVVSANRSFYRSFHVQDRQTEGQLLYQLGNGQWDIPQLRNLLGEILPSLNAVENFLVEHDFLDIGRRVMLLNARKLWRPGNHVELILLAIEDITERHLAETTKDDTMHELERSNSDLVQFAHVVSHDLLSPVRTINGFTALLQRRAHSKLDGTELEYLDLITSAATRMSNLVNGLLHYAQVGQNQTELKPVCMEQILASTLANLDAPISETRAEISRDPLPDVQGDPIQLLQLLQNLISNALKYKAHDKTPRVAISASSKSGEWVFQVADNGLGIPLEYQQTVFQPLTRLHGNEVSGTGLGLSTCRKIVERHGGRIWVESAGNDGATFYFSLPKVVD